MAENNVQSSDPTVLNAIWRYRWLVLFVAIAFAGLGWMYGSRTTEWTATATLAVQDPRSSNLFDQAIPNSPERYVEGQVAILRSRAIVRRAVEIAGDQNPPIDVSVEEVILGLSVEGSPSSDIITVSYTDETQREAIGVANAVAAAYLEIGGSTTAKAFADAGAELDRTIAVIQTELDTFEEQISVRQLRVLDELEHDPERVANRQLLDDLMLQLIVLEPPSVSASDGQVTRFSTELQLLSLRISTIGSDLDQERAVVLALEQDNPERVALVRLQTEAQRRLTDLQTRSDQLAVDADLVSNGVVQYLPAETAVVSGSSMFIVLGFMVGLAIGSGVAVLLSNRRRRFDSRTEPEQILGTRLLSDVPNFRSERVESKLPVIDAPTSVSAEAFRFVSASVSLQQLWPANDDGAKNFKSVVTLSAGLFEGKTVVTANTAFAVSREGHNVLVVDADFGNQQLTGLLLDSKEPPLGMTDVVAGTVALDKAVVKISDNDGRSIDLLSRGRAPGNAPDFFGSTLTKNLFKAAYAKYDLVLIDAPPLLRVAYASTLARLADRAIIVIAHGEEVHAVEELRDQIDLIGIPMVGYVYNLAPLRPEMTVSAGSMADTLGDQPTFVVRPE